MSAVRKAEGTTSKTLDVRHEENMVSAAGHIPAFPAVALRLQQSDRRAAAHFVILMHLTS